MTVSICPLESSSAGFSKAETADIGIAVGFPKSSISALSTGAPDAPEAPAPSALAAPSVPSEEAPQPISQEGRRGVSL